MVGGCTAVASYFLCFGEMILFWFCCFCFGKTYTNSTSEVIRIEQ